LGGGRLPRAGGGGGGGGGGGPTSGTASGSGMTSCMPLRIFSLLPVSGPEYSTQIAAPPWLRLGLGV
jgi:hypothetical protein